jgi:hypothetical protein
MAAMCGSVTVDAAATLRLRISGTSVIVRRLDSNGIVTSVDVILPKAPWSHPSKTANAPPSDKTIPGHNAFLEFPSKEFDKRTTRGQLMTSAVDGSENGFFILDNGEDLSFEKDTLEQRLSFVPSDLTHLAKMGNICPTQCSLPPAPEYSARLTLLDGTFQEGQRSDDSWQFKSGTHLGPVYQSLLQEVVVTWKLKGDSLVVKSTMPGTSGNIVLSKVKDEIDLTIGTAPMGLLMNPPAMPISQTVDTHFENVYSVVDCAEDQPPVPWRQKKTLKLSSTAAKQGNIRPQKHRIHGVGNCPPVMIDAMQIEVKK